MKKTMFSLPPPQMPFPVKVPFKISSDLYRLGKAVFQLPEDSIFLLDAHYQKYVATKLDLLIRYPLHSRCYLKDDAHGLQDCFWDLLKQIADEHPRYFVFDQNGFENRLLGLKLTRCGDLSTLTAGDCFLDLQTACYRHLMSVTGLERLLDFIALSVQEDLVMLKAGTEKATDDCADCLLVTMPTHWDPRDKLGLNFSAIHRPVANRTVLEKAHPNLIRAMINQGPFVRYNWSMTAVDQLCLNPKLLPSGGHSLSELSPIQRDPIKLSPIADAATAEQGGLIERLYFRVERQTVVSFAGRQRCVFGIRILQQPLAAVTASADRRIVLADAIESMSQEVLRYRSMQAFATQLIEELRLS